MNLQLRPALVSFIALSVITGLAYPLVITGLSKLIFPRQPHRQGRQGGRL
jgi:K+-transporting ATPase ATPase C chain